MKLSLGLQPESPRREGVLLDRKGCDDRRTSLNLLGMTLVDVALDDEPSRKLGSRHGVAVLLAERDSDAYLAGVRNGDLLAEVNNAKITRLDDLRRVLRGHDPHEPVLVFLWDGRGWRFVNLSFISSRP